MNPRPIILTFTSPAAPNGPGGAVFSRQFGFGEFPLWTFTARLIAVAGGSLDILIQTADVPPDVIDPVNNFTGPWTDIIHFTTIPAGVTTPAHRVAIARGFTSPGTVTPVNQTDLGNAPVLASGAILNWANGNAMRTICIAGAGVATSAIQTIIGLASES